MIDSILEEDTDLLANAFDIENMDAHHLMHAIGDKFQADGVARALKMTHRLGDKKVIRAPRIFDAVRVLQQQFRDAIRSRT